MSVPEIPYYVDKFAYPMSTLDTMHPRYSAYNSHHTTEIPRRVPTTIARARHTSYLPWNDAREGGLTSGRHCMAPCVGARPHNRPQSSQPHPLARLGDSTPVAHNRTCEACLVPCVHHHTIFFTTKASSSRKIASSWGSWHSCMAA